MESAKTPIKETIYTTKRPEDYKAPEPNKEIEGITSKKIGEEKQKDLIKNINAQTQKQTEGGGGSTTSYGGGGSGSSGSGGKIVKIGGKNYRCKNC